MRRFDRARRAEVTIADEGEHVRVRVRGGIDLTNVAIVEAELRFAEQLAAKPMVVDLSETNFMDVRGARALVAASRRARLNGRPFRVVEASEQARRLFDALGPARLRDLVVERPAATKDAS